MKIITSTSILKHTDRYGAVDQLKTCKILNKFNHIAFLRLKHSY